MLVLSPLGFWTLGLVGNVFAGICTASTQPACWLVVFAGDMSEETIGFLALKTRLFVTRRLPGWVWCFGALLGSAFAAAVGGGGRMLSGLRSTRFLCWVWVVGFLYSGCLHLYFV